MLAAMKQPASTTTEGLKASKLRSKPAVRAPASRFRSLSLALQVGIHVDVRDPMGMWLAAEVVEVKSKSADCKVHYKEWGATWVLLVAAWF